MDGLYLLWWVQEKHLSAFVVATILGAGDFALMALEVPTGWFADRYGHRASLILGSIAQVGGMLLCWFGEGIPGVLSASLLVALGDAFRSGADQALLYRTCVAMDRERDFQPLVARARAMQLGAMVGLVLAGGAIASAWGLPAGWLVETALCTAGLAIACAMVEPPASSEPEACEKAIVGGLGPIRSLMTLILPGALLGASASAVSFLAQTTGRWDPQGVTILVAIITLAEAAGSGLAVRLPETGVRFQLALAGAGLLLLVVPAVAPITFLPIVVGLALLDGVAHPLRAAAIQRLVADGVRARAASIASACDMAIQAMVLPLAGRWRSRRS